MRYFKMPARGVADDTKKRISEFTNHGRKAKPSTLDAAFRREAVAPWLYRTCIERGGRPGVCSDDENAHPCEIGQLGIAKRMTSAAFAWHYSKL